MKHRKDCYLPSLDSTLPLGRLLLGATTERSQYKQPTFSAEQSSKLSVIAITTLNLIILNKSRISETVLEISKLQPFKIPEADHILSIIYCVTQLVII